MSNLPMNLKVFCNECDYHGILKDFLDNCPKCKSNRIVDAETELYL